jgi:lipopolysaccharide export system permease protein
MKKIIYRKIAEDCIKFFFLTILTIGSIIWVLQAVNYLDFVVEDGHGFLVYFKYTLLNFPKIISRIYPFAIFLSFSYILVKYENKNELVIFWNFGIKKIDFINFFIKVSFIFVLLSLILNAFISPFSQDRARSFIRSSDIDFFEGILKPKKFIDTVKNLTIYFDKKGEKGELENIFLKDNADTNNYKIIFAKKGVFEFRGDKKILVLYNGKTIDNKNGKISEFEFSRSDFNLTRFGSKSTLHQKTQENSTNELVKCLSVLKNSKDLLGLKKIHNINNCKLENKKNIYKELYIRLIKPFYITYLISVSLLLILRSKDEPSYKFFRFKIYLVGFLSIVFFEASSSFVGVKVVQNFFIFLLPFLFFSIIYYFFLIQLKFKTQ